MSKCGYVDYFSADFNTCITACNFYYRKYMCYRCDETESWIANVINKVEREDKHKLVRALNGFCER